MEECNIPGVGSFKSAGIKIHNSLTLTEFHVPGIGTEIGTLEECEAYKKYVIKTKKRLEKLQKKYVDLLKSCPHPTSCRESKQRYIEGSYTDRAYTEYWTECSLCKHHSNIIREDHSWYG